MDTAALGLLLQPANLELLSTLPPYDEATTMAQSAQLRAQGIDPALTATLLTQSRLRAKAVTKLGQRAHTMLFTAAALEQATRWPVAQWHAERYQRAGVTHVADLTSGIGVDSLAFATQGLAVSAYEIDEATALLATHNLRDFSHAQVVLGDGLQVDLGSTTASPVDGIFADPARRTTRGTRVVNPHDYLPPLDSVWALRDRIAAVGIKVGPGIPHHGLPAEAEVEWISVDGDVLEAGLWFGPLALGHAGSFSARVAHTAPDGQLHSAIVRGRPDSTPGAAPLNVAASTTALGQYLYEPDGAVIRAHLLGSLVAAAGPDSGARLLDAQIAYLSTDAPLQPVDGISMATGYRVLDIMPFSLKRLKAYLRQRQVGSLTIKKRGTAVIPEQLRPQLALQGAGRATIVLTRVAGSQHVLVVEPLEVPQ